MKTKRIKAITTRLHGLENGKPVPRKVYLIRASDVRALAEQFVADANKEAVNPRSKVYDRVAMQLHVLKRAGITPGRKGAR